MKFKQFLAPFVILGLAMTTLPGLSLARAQFSTVLPDAPLIAPIASSDPELVLPDAPLIVPATKIDPDGALPDAPLLFPVEVVEPIDGAVGNSDQTDQAAQPVDIFPIDEVIETPPVSPDSATQAELVAEPIDLFPIDEAIDLPAETPITTDQTDQFVEPVDTVSVDEVLPEHPTDEVAPIDTIIPVDEAVPVTPAPEEPALTEEIRPITPAGGSSGGSSGGGFVSSQTSLPLGLSPFQLLALLQFIQNNQSFVTPVAQAAIVTPEPTPAPVAPVETATPAPTPSAPVVEVTEPAVIAPEAPAPTINADQLQANVGQVQVGFFSRIGHWFVNLFQSIF